jgi:EAL domain-containing protein (putative c-di-GMP-specific phosphodiesterase class I)
VSRSVGLAHIVRQDDGTATGVWGVHTLKSAFQPIFAFQDGKLTVMAYEGLLRAFRDDQPVSPGQFFASVPAIDRLHIETLSRTLHLLNAGSFLDPQASIFVNFDPSVFSEREVADKALQEMRLVLHEADIDPRRIVCEVTEQQSPSEDALFSFVNALRGHGFRIAVDDYGSDDSDIRRINELKPDIVKFDAHWITHLMESGPGFSLLSAMVDTFARQGIVTVFEGIEENWQLELAERSGATMVQGFVLARPEIAPTSFAHFARGIDSSGEAAPSIPASIPFGTDAAGAQPKQQRGTARPFGRRSAAP